MAALEPSSKVLEVLVSAWRQGAAWNAHEYWGELDQTCIADYPPFLAFTGDTFESLVQQKASAANSQQSLRDRMHVLLPRTSYQQPTNLFISHQCTMPVSKISGKERKQRCSNCSYRTYRHSKLHYYRPLKVATIFPPA